MVKAKKFILKAPFDGFPKRSDFELQEEDLPALKDGEYLAEALFLSVDPYMRGYMARLPPRSVMIGIQVAKVLESRNKDYTPGELVVLQSGWRTHTISDGKTNGDYKLPPMGDLSPSLGCGSVGMPGMTAYFGFLELCQPKAGETVVVSGAAGAVGSLVGQIAKLKKCKVIGYAGTDAKCKWLKEELGFDHAFNYKTKDIGQSLKEAAPEGVDCYFDNVGGMTAVTVMNHMNLFGRIANCGSISSYNDTEVATGPYIFALMVRQQLRSEGFNVLRWRDSWPKGLMQMIEWIKEGKVKVREHVTYGFEKMPEAFMGMLRGENTGKAVVAAK
ncbi:unnamed protein product [Owenia fusiformis]|uniref:Prostaglandin reductase 1 n=1 Tax=Owenia fusiformis TaxID=6347 RepID=A0A8J1Y1G7_OWEFU|nr:unnamed protein product [Owenia fusiformis]